MGRTRIYIINIRPIRPLKYQQKEWLRLSLILSKKQQQQHTFKKYVHLKYRLEVRISFPVVLNYKYDFKDYIL